FEIASLAAALVEGHQLLHVFVSNRTAEGASGQVGKDFRGALGFLCGFTRVAYENTLAAWALAHAGDFDRTAYLNGMYGVHARLATFKWCSRRTLVAFCEAALLESNRDGV